MLLLPALVFELLRLGLHHFEGRESEERRWLSGHGSLLSWESGLQALLGAVGETVMVVAVEVMVVVDVENVFIRAEVLGFGVLLQLMRLVAPVLGVLLLLVVVVVMMELHLFRHFLKSFFFVG